MNLGFLGTGKISNAMIRGICKNSHNYQIFISPRNIKISSQLKKDFSYIKITKDNQELIQQSNLIFVALPQQKVKKILKSLVFFRGQKIITFVPNTRCFDISSWIKEKILIFRAIPLPFIEEHNSITPIFPSDPDVKKIFEKIGGVIELDNEHEFQLFMHASSLMGIYFHIASVFNAWLTKRGLQEKNKYQFLKKIFFNLSKKAIEEEKASFDVLKNEHSTPGGSNEMITRLFVENGGDRILNIALDESYSILNKNRFLNSQN